MVEYREIRSASYDMYEIGKNYRQLEMIQNQYR